MGVISTVLDGKKGKERNEYCNLAYCNNSLDVCDLVVIGKLIRGFF